MSENIDQWIHTVTASFILLWDKWRKCFRKKTARNTFATGLQIYRPWKSEKNQGYFGWLSNRIAPQPIAQESCSNPQDLVSLWVRNGKKIVFGLFVSGVICKVGGFWPFFGCWYLTWSQPLDRSISLKFSVKTSLESESFETLINFIAFPVQKLWSIIK